MLIIAGARAARQRPVTVPQWETTDDDDDDETATYNGRIGDRCPSLYRATTTPMATTTSRLLATHGLASRMREAILGSDVCKAQDLFAKAQTSDLRAALPLLLRTARMTGDDALEARTRAAMAALNEDGDPTTSSRQRRQRRRLRRRRTSAVSPTKRLLDEILAASSKGPATRIDAVLSNHANLDKLFVKMGSLALPRNSERTLQCLNAALSRSRDPDVSGKILRTMRAWGLCPDAYTVNAILQGPAKGIEDATAKASVLVRQLWVTGNPPDAYTVALLSSDLFRRNVDALDALGMVRAFAKHGIPGDASAYEKVLRLCARQGEAELARACATEMGLLGLEVAEAHAVLGYTSVSRDRTQRHLYGGSKDDREGGDGGKADHLRAEVEFWDRLAEREGLGPSPSLLSARFAALGAANLVSRALADFERLLRDKRTDLLVRDTSASNAVLALLAKRPQTAHKCREVCHELASLGFEPDAYARSALLNAVAVGPMVDLGEALAVVDAMGEPWGRRKGEALEASLTIVLKIVRKVVPNEGVALLQAFQEKVAQAGEHSLARRVEQETERLLDRLARK